MYSCAEETWGESTMEFGVVMARRPLHSKTQKNKDNRTFLVL